MQERSIISSPILVSFIHYVVDCSANYQYPHIDRLWLGTWNSEVLQECLQYARPHTYQLPTRISHALMQQFDTVSARLQCVLARAFLNLHSLARQRTPPPSTTADTPAPLRIPTTTQQRNKQTRLTTIWQVPPPHIADAPLPQPPPARTQLLLTSYLLREMQPHAPLLPLSRLLLLLLPTLRTLPVRSARTVAAAHLQLPTPPTTRFSASPPSSLNGCSLRM